MKSKKEDCISLIRQSPVVQNETLHRSVSSPYLHNLTVLVVSMLWTVYKF